MALLYKKAETEDLELLVETRIQVLRAANRLDASIDMSEVEAQSYAYYRRALADGTHTAYLAFDGELLAGTGGVSFFQVLPTFHNPSGYRAYIMNMYTHPSCRRRGIATKTLDLLVSEAREKGIIYISLEATQLGRPLYEHYGFVRRNDEMWLPEGQGGAAKGHVDEAVLDLGQLHTTELGIKRIRKNLCLEVEDVLDWCRKRMEAPGHTITRRGKNWYINAAGIEWTVNAHSNTIITAHRKKEY